MARIAIMWAVFAEYNKMAKAVNPYGDCRAHRRM